MDARKLSFGDLVKYHDTVLAFVGIQKCSRDSDSYEAIYNGPYAVQAMVDDPSIMPVLITDKNLEADGFQWSLNDDGHEVFYHPKGNVILTKDSLGFWIVDCFSMSLRNSIQEFTVKWYHELQAILRTCGFDEFARNLGASQNDRIFHHTDQRAALEEAQRSERGLDGRQLL